MSGAETQHILRASTLMHFMHSQTMAKKPAGSTGEFAQYEQTAFGKEVGRDEINWWVFKKEANLDEKSSPSRRWSCEFADARMQ